MLSMVMLRQKILSAAFLHILIVLFFSISISVILVSGGYKSFLGFIIVISLLLLLLTQPKLSIYILSSLLTMRGLIIGGGRFLSGLLLSFDLGGLINILTLFLGITYLIVNRKTPFCDKLAKVYIAFLAFCALSLMYAESFSEGIRFLTRLASPFVFYLIVVNEIKSEKDINGLVKCIFFSAIIPISLGVYQYITGHGNLSTEGFVRIYGSFGHPNEYSFYLIFLFCIAYTCLLSRNFKWKFCLFLLNALITFLIIQTYCRITWIVFIIIFFFLNYRYRQKKIIITSLILGFPICIYLSPSIIARFQDVIYLLSGENLLRTDISLGWRFNAWICLLRRVPEHLLIGHGLSSVVPLMRELYNEQATPHNGYLRILYDTGLIGFSLFISVIFVMIGQGKELISGIKRGCQLDKISIYLSCLIAFIVILISDNILEYYTVAIYFWIFFAVGSNINKGLKINEMCGYEK